MESKRELLDLWDFNWGVMSVMIGGKSAIDLDAIKVKDWDDATNFLKFYGFDPDDKDDAKYIHAVIVESISFISRKLMPREWDKGNRPPADFLEVYDARKILLWASDTSQQMQTYQIWACALLRVMHTITHIEGIRRHVQIDTARQQIMGRLEKYVFLGRNEELRFGTPYNSVKLSKIEWKRNKKRESIIVKLLHKRGNVAETIYDLLGVRIVTERLCDVMVVVKLLRDLYMITFPNCNPGRARNTLIDLDHFKLNIDVLRSMLEEDRITPKEFASLVERVVAPTSSHQDKIKNPHTSATYKSVQLTCRQLIIGKEGKVSWKNRIKDYLASSKAKEEAKELAMDILKFSSLYEKFEEGVDHGYFPFEIHILDKASYAANKEGDASHDRYKKSQIKAARRRVLGRVLTQKKTKKASKR